MLNNVILSLKNWVILCSWLNVLTNSLLAGSRKKTTNIQTLKQTYKQQQQQKPICYMNKYITTYNYMSLYTVI